MSAFAGIDYDSKGIHVVRLLEDELPVYTRYVLGKEGDAFDRTRLVRDAMPSRGWWLDEGITAIGIEEPMGQSTRPLNRIQGAIISCLPTLPVLQPLMPQEWRVELGLSGNCSKEDVAWWVANELLSERHLPETHRSAYRRDVAEWPQDACDAYCLARVVEKKMAVVL